MSNVIDLNEWRRKRLGHGPAMASRRRFRRDRGKMEKTPATGSDLSNELRRLLNLE